MVHRFLRDWQVPHDSIKEVINEFYLPNVHRVDSTMYAIEVSTPHLITEKVRDIYLGFRNGPALLRQFSTITHTAEQDLTAMIPVEQPEHVTLRTLFLGRFKTEAANLGSARAANCLDQKLQPTVVDSPVPA
jgi:hypothetical protein